jgi:hypothetical protein
MTVSTLATRATRNTVVALTAGILSTLAAVLGAGSASAHTAAPAVTVRAVGIAQTSGCPQTTTFTARVLSNGPAVVHYHWLRSDGSASPQGTLRFRGRGHHSYAVHYDWTLSGDVSGWEQLVVTTPDRVATRRMNFSTYCATGVYVADVTATDSSALCSDVYTDLGGELEFWHASDGIRYYWTVDGTVVGDTTVTDPSVLASGVLNPTFHYAFIPPHGTTYHDVELHIQATDGTGNSDFYSTTFSTTCA